MKIVVIGGGTGGGHGMVMCSRSPENLKIDLIHDPNSPIIGVGESLSHDFVQLLRGALQFQFPFDMKEVNAQLNMVLRLWTGVSLRTFLKATDICLCLVKEYTRHIFLEIICTARRLKHYWGHKFKEVHGTVDRFWQDSKRAYLSNEWRDARISLYY